MSKRNSLGNTSATNTLFKYFTKSPASSPKTPQQNRNTASASSTTPKSSFTKDKSIDTESRSSNKKDNNDQCDDDDSPIRSAKPKRLKLIDSDSESDQDRENASNNVPAKKVSRPAVSEPLPQPTKKKMKMDEKATVAMSFEEKLKQMEVQKMNDVEEKLEEIVDEPMQWLHNKLDFLKPEYIKDINGHRPDHAEYDQKTLFIPKHFLEKLTPVRFT